MNKIQKVSSFLIITFNVLLIGIPVLFTLQWAAGKWKPVQYLKDMGFFKQIVETPEGMIDLSKIQFTPLSWTIGYSSEIVGFIPVFLGLLVLRRLFKNYMNNSIFTYDNAKDYRLLGWLFFFNAVFFKPLSDTMLVLSATLPNPPGHRYISLNFGTPNLEDLLCAFLILVISWVMAEGYKLKEEQSLTV